MQALCISAKPSASILPFHNFQHNCTHFVSKCAICKQQKSVGSNYRHFPACITNGNPFDKIFVNCMKPWNFTTSNNHCAFFNSCLYWHLHKPFWSYFPFCQKQHCGCWSHQSWMDLQVPQTLVLFHDNGGELNGTLFWQLLKCHRIEPVSVMLEICNWTINKCTHLIIQSVCETRLNSNLDSQHATNEYASDHQQCPYVHSMHFLHSHQLINDSKLCCFCQKYFPVCSWLCHWKISSGVNKCTLTSIGLPKTSTGHCMIAKLIIKWQSLLMKLLHACFHCKWAFQCCLNTH